MQGLYKKVIKGEYPALPRTFSQDLHSIVASLLQINPANRLSCAQLLAHPGIIRHSSDVLEQETASLLLQTINFPQKLSKIAENFPKPNFEDSLPSSNKSLALPKMGNKSSVLRDVSEPPGKTHQDRENSEKSLYYLQKYRKMILKENYGALRLPKVRYPFQKYSTEKNARTKANDYTIVPRVKSEKISRKPSTNRSLIGAHRLHDN